MFCPGQVRRSPNGYREFTDGARERVMLVLAGRRAGFSLHAMRTQMQGWATVPDAEREEILGAQLAVLEQRAEEIDSSRAEITQALAALAARRRGA